MKKRANPSQNPDKPKLNSIKDSKESKEPDPIQYPLTPNSK